MEDVQIKDKLDLINQANECSVLMGILCQKLGLLEPNKVTHTEFVKSFSELQAKSLEAQKEMSEYFMLSQPVRVPKQRKKRDSIEEADNQDD